MPRQFPHLLQEDQQLWIRFLEANPTMHKQYDYDVRVGTGRDPGPETDSNVRLDAVMLSQRRIDAVGLNPDAITIVEISLNAGFTQIGELIAYPVLYRQTFKPTLPLRRLLVAETLQTDIEPVLFEFGIPFLLFPKED